MPNDAPDLEMIPDNRRAPLELWLAGHDDEDLDTDALASLVESTTTREELAVFFSPFDRADELLVRLETLLHGERATVGDAEIVAAATEHLAEMARNARAVGEHELAELAEAVPEFRLVDEDDVPRRDEWLDADLAGAIAEAVSGDLASSGDAGAVENLERVVGEWLLDDLATSYVLQPLLTDVEVELSAFLRLRSMRAGTRFASDTALVWRWGGLGHRSPMPRANLQDRATKAAARADVDWAQLPTEAADVERLETAAEAGDYPSLAKLSLMTLSGVGAEQDTAKAFGLLERAAGDYESVVACYRAGQHHEIAAAAAEYGLMYLHDQGWGVPESSELAWTHRVAAAEGGFPRAMYTMGLTQYDIPDGVELTEADQEAWLSKAAAAGETPAYGQLFHLYERRGLSDTSEAFEAITNAADLDAWSDYQWRAGGAHERGEGTDVDLVRAFTWYYLASCQNLGKTRPHGLDDLVRVMEQLSDAEVAEGTARAHAWIEERSADASSFLSRGAVYRDPLALIER